MGPRARWLGGLRCCPAQHHRCLRASHGFLGEPASRGTGCAAHAEAPSIRWAKGSGPPRTIIGRQEPGTAGRQGPL
jgi:hypothetical protein